MVTIAAMVTIRRRLLAHVNSGRLHPELSAIEVCRVRARAPVTLKAVDDRQLVCGQVEAEDVQVFPDPLRG